MDLPKFDLTSLPQIDPTILPDLAQLIGMYGSMRTGQNSSIIVIASIVYEGCGGPC